jgi:hypothetical protein
MSKSNPKSVARRRAARRPINPEFVAIVDHFHSASDEFDGMLARKEELGAHVLDVISDSRNAHRIQDGIALAEACGANAAAQQVEEHRKHVEGVLVRLLAYSAEPRPGAAKMKAVALLRHIDTEPRRRSSLADRWLVPILRQSGQAIAN